MPIKPCLQENALHYTCVIKGERSEISDQIFYLKKLEKGQIKSEVCRRQK